MKESSFVQKTSREKKIDILRLEHLRDGIKPIMACLADYSEDSNSLDLNLEAKTIVKNRLADAFHVDFFKPGEQIKNAGKSSFAISPIDERSKLSFHYFNCTGLVVSGLDKETGKEISFLSHQNPNYFVKKEVDNQFFKALDESLEEINERCVLGTIDAVIFGGNYVGKPNTNERTEKLREFEAQADYKTSIKLLAQAVLSTLGFEPLIITGPKQTGGSDSVYYDTSKRQLYLVRPEVGNETSKAYIPSDFKRQSKKWQN